MAFAQASVEQAESVAALAHEAGVPLLGPNSIGFVNYARSSAGTWSVPARCDTGGIALVIQSGATYAVANSIEPRARFSLTVHPGQEIGVTVATIADYALSLPGTRVLGLFLETIRDPESFDAMLAAAAARNVAVVALKVGRTESGARHVVSHAGRLAGGEAAFAAVCRRHGVVRVDDMDEWWATLLVLGALPKLGPGGLVAITDSGGQRALLADHAETIGLAWADIGEATRGNLAASLPSDLPPVNPLDAWAGQPNWIDVFANCLDAMVADPVAALGVVVTEFGAAITDPLPQGMAEVCRRVAAARPSRSSPPPPPAANSTRRSACPGS
ncbi:MAG: hypothetical protein EXQ94_10775 [Alphaproteobacteria bacterium]|nr:hypothetical protein [Alphaproteobacteria bacterium]